MKYLKDWDDLAQLIVKFFEACIKILPSSNVILGWFSFQSLNPEVKAARKLGIIIYITGMWIDVLKQLHNHVVYML